MKEIVGLSEIVFIKPVFKVVLHKNVNVLDQVSMKMFKEEDWYPVGGIGRKGNDWVQMMVKEG